MCSPSKGTKKILCNNSFYNSSNAISTGLQRCLLDETISYCSFNSYYLKFGVHSSISYYFTKSFSFFSDFYLLHLFIKVHILMLAYINSKNPQHVEYCPRMRTVMYIQFLELFPRR